MRSKIISILLIGLFLLVSCERKTKVTEQNLIGIWKEIDSTDRNIIESKGIKIVGVGSDLFQEDITILTSTDEIKHSRKGGCFIELKLNEKEEQSLLYACFSNEFEYTVNMTTKKLVIENRIFEKYRTANKIPLRHSK